MHFHSEAFFTLAFGLVDVLVLENVDRNQEASKGKRDMKGVGNGFIFIVVRQNRKVSEKHKG